MTPGGPNGYRSPIPPRRVAPALCRRFDTTWYATLTEDGAVGDDNGLGSSLERPTR